MGFTLKNMAKLLNKIIAKGIDFIVIGDTSIQLAMGRDLFEGDIDLFVLNPGIVGYEELYLELATENEWYFGYTEVGTPRLIARIDDKEIVVELYENMLDFNIPEQILREASTTRIEDITVKVLKPEQYIVLKAKQGVDLDKVKNVIREFNRIDMKLIKKTLNYIEEDREVVESRLAEIGLEL